MEIRRWVIYIVFNCILVTHLTAKTVSLNELIAAESKQTPEKGHRTKSTDLVAKTVSLNELLTAESKQKEAKTHRTKSTDTASAAKPFSRKQATPAESRQKIEKTRFPKIAKTPRRQSFSLKDLFAAEAKQTKHKIESLLSRTSGTGLLSHRKRLFPPLSLKFESAESLLSRPKSLTPLNIRKKFEIKSPLKPQRLKFSLIPKRKKLSIKREIYENERSTHKYIPLIKRLGLLVDDILTPESGESHSEISAKQHKPRHNKSKQSDDRKVFTPESGESHSEISAKQHKPRHNKAKQSDDRKVSKCRCDPESDAESAESTSLQKTVTTSTTLAAEITADTETEAPTTAAYNTSTSNVYTVRPDPNLSLLFTRNSTSSRRDYYGYSERSSPPLYRDAERNITGNNGHDEYNTREERDQTCSSDHEENSCGSTRNDTRSNRSVDRLHRDRTNPQYPTDRPETEETDKVARTVDGFFRRGSDEYEEKNKFEVGRETEETISLPRDVRGFWGNMGEHKNDSDTKSVQPKEAREESFFNVTYNHSSPERIAQRNGAIAEENQKLRPTVERVMSLNDPFNQFKYNSQPNQVVTIFDGYSVARDINGRNKLSEKSIHFSS